MCMPLTILSYNFSTVQLQKKLDNYERKKRHLELTGLAPPLTQYGSSSSHNSATDMQSNVGGNGGTTSVVSGSKQAKKVRDGLKHVTDMSKTVMSKPKEFANLIMKGHHGSSGTRHHKFGSADNLSSLSKESDRDSEVSSTKKGRSLGREGQIGVSGRSDHGSGGRGSIFSSNERTSSFEDRRKCLSEDGRRLGPPGRNRSTEASESDATSDSVPPPPPSLSTAQASAALAASVSIKITCALM